MRSSRRILGLVLGLGLGLGLGQAEAQDLRKAKLKEVQIKVVVPGKQPVKRDIGKIGPSKLDPAAQEALSGRIAEKERLMSQKRQAMIRAVDEILAANPNYHAKWDRLFQKAELQWEEARYEYFQKRRDYETQLEAFHEKRSTTKPAEPKGNYGPAVTTYRQIIAGQPNYRRLDEVLYHLGDALIKADQGVEAVTTLGQLTTKFPQSKHVVDAYLALAELYFDKNKFVAAHDNYQAVVTKFPGSQIANYAYYKLAWTFFNLKDYRKSINGFKSVVERTGGGTQSRINFKNQALNDLVVAFAEVDDGWQEARDYFQKQGGETLALDKLRKMARYYDGQDKNEETLRVLNFLIARKPGSPEVPELHEFFIDTLKKINNPKRLESELRKIVEFYAPSAPFMSDNKGNGTVVAKGAKIAEDALDFVAASFHSEAQRFHDNAKYRLAAQGYDEFLRRFPSSKRSYKINFYLAEILLRLEDLEGAAIRYQQVVGRGKGEYYEDASYKVIFAYAEQLKKLGLDKDVVAEPIGGRRAAKGAAPVAAGPRPKVVKSPLHPVEDKFVKASEQFAKNFPKSDDTPVILYKAAKVYYQHSHLAEAAGRLIQIIKDHPRHKFAAHSGTLVLECYNRLEDWANIEKWARHLLNLKNFQDKGQKELRNIVAQAMSKYAAQLEAEKKYSEASKVMLKVVEEFPKSETADKALFNAAAIAERAAQRDRAIELYERLKRSYPKSDLVPQARFVIGAIYESRGQFHKAAQNYAQMAKEKATDKTADAIYNAAVIREALGEFKEAIATFQTYMKLYPKRDDIPGVYLRIGEVLEKSKDLAGAVKHFEGFAKKFPAQGQLAVEAYARAGLAAQKGAGPGEVAPTGKKARRGGGGKGVGLAAANGYFNRAVETFRKVKAAPGSEAARYAAWARFQQGEAIFQEFEAIRFKLPESAMRRTFGEKKAALAKVIKAYLEVAQFRSPEWAAAAAYKIGLAYQKLSEAFFEAPVPPDFKEEDKEAYRAQLQEFAVPIEEQAIDAFEKAVRLAHKQRIYNQWTALSGKHLAKYKKDEYPLLDKAQLKPGISAETQRAAPVQKVAPAKTSAAPGARVL